MRVFKVVSPFLHWNQRLNFLSIWNQVDSRRASRRVEGLP
jgi:hypothetical protein